MNGNSSYIGSDQLKTYTVDQVADWLCQVGFRDCTAKFLERNIDGKKLLDLQEFQLNNFILSDNKRKRAFWSLLESVRNNNQSNPPNSNMFSGGGGRLPPSRPPKSMPGFGTHNNGRVPPRRPPPNQTFEPMNPNLIHDVNYDSFSDGDDNYMDEVETLPPPKRRPRGPGQTPFRRSGEFGNFRLPMPSPHEARSFSVDFTNNPPPVGRKPRASVPNYTPVTLKNKAHMHPPGPPGNPPLPGRRPPARLPGDEPPPPQGYHHSAPPPRPPAHIPIIPYSAEAAPPAIPGRSPMRSPYDDHQLPNRPPPLPPLAAPTSPPQAPLPKFSPLPHRSGSDKTDSSPHSQSPISFSSEITSHLKSRQGNISTESRDSGHGSPGASREPSWKSGNRLPTGHLPNRKHNSSTESRESGQGSPVASRGPSWKNQGFPIAHLPDRKNHASTGSNSSSGSDDLTKPPVTKDTFAGMKKDKLPKFPPTLHNKFHSTGKPTMPMPHFSNLTTTTNEDRNRRSTMVSRH
uniref:pollen-specific leucine-rich repeat extensin-like protein 1 isoform X6 n=1 Tax=Styela clava TaxID=7725 RepID=UPI00193A74A3|nr:pollen-specific leucine-rich repeat extensin-like protein 1 isoform X6 [Styela clava]